MFEPRLGLVTRLAAITFFIAIPVIPAYPGGFQISEQCTVCQGKRNAGSAASADAPGTIYFNPASMSWLEGTQLDISVHHIAGTFNFNNSGSTNIDGDPLVGIPNKNGAESATIASISFTHQFNDRWSAGIGATVPYGLVTNYNSQWVGRYHANKSDLAIITISPLVSFRLNDQWALAGGFTWQHADAELSNNMDIGGILNRTLADQLPSALLPEPGDPDRDALAKLTGDDHAFGYNLGLMWEPREGTRLGVGYRSKIKLTLDGDLKVKASPGLAAFLEQLPIDPGLEPIKVGGSADLDTPNSVWSSVYHEINDRWRVMASATWTQWTAFSEIVIEIEDEGGEIVQPEGWNNQWRLGAGVEFDYTPNLTFRSGFEYDETPVHPSSNTARIPDEDRVWFAFGSTWHPRSYDRLAIDFAYSHIFINDYSMNEREVFTSQTIHAITGEDNNDANTLRGNYKADADIFSLGVRWKFGKN